MGKDGMRRVIRETFKDIPLDSQEKLIGQGQDMLSHLEQYDPLRQLTLCKVVLEYLEHQIMKETKKGR